MRKTAILFLLLFITFAGFAQENEQSTIPGEWTIQELESGVAKVRVVGVPDNYIPEQSPVFVFFITDAENIRFAMNWGTDVMDEYGLYMLGNDARVLKHPWERDYGSKRVFFYKNNDIGISDYDTLEMLGGIRTLTLKSICPDGTQVGVSFDMTGVIDIIGPYAESKGWMD